MKQIYEVRPLFGCDPEFFFTAQDGHVVGAETVLPDGGLKYNDKAVGTGSRNTTTYVAGGGKVVIDGVQAEMHPHPNTCRANIGFELAECFRTIKAQLAAKGVGADFGRTVVEVDPAVLAALSDEAKKLGCAPSQNAHGLGSAELAAVNAVEYRKRSAGGHIHMSGSGVTGVDPATLATIMDYVVGNTCVLLDRDPNTAERRRLYGRAGEFRTPLATKGAGAEFEYRTLSNFWLRDYRLMSLVMGLCRIGASFTHHKVHGEVLAAVDKQAIIEAINTNNFELARANFNKIRPLIEAGWPHHSGGSSVPFGGSGSIDAFDYFVDKGLDFWFPAEGTVDRWAAVMEGHGTGWENFLWTKVAPAYRAAKVAEAAAKATAAAVQPTPVEQVAPATVEQPVQPTPAKAPLPLNRDARGRFAPAKTAQPIA